MYLVTNSVQPQQVTDNGDHYLIENVPIVKPMDLSGGYVPRWSIKETANKWDKTVPTLNHPRNKNGEPIAANQKPELHIGEVVSSNFDGEFARSDIKIDKSELERLGGEATDIQDALENGEKISVSSQYRAQELPPGEYDGEYRQDVERIVEPDSIAILPNKRGKCSISDGCGINPEMVANAEVTIPMTEITDNKTVAGVTFEDTAEGDLDESELDSEEHNLEEHYLYGEGEDKEDFSYPVVDADMTLRRGNVDAAHQLGCRGQCPSAEEHDETLQELAEQFENPPEWAMDSASKHMEDNALRKIGRSVLDMVGLSASDVDSVETTGAESLAGNNDDGTNGGKSPSSADSDPTMNREKLIDEITANSPLTEDSLEERCNDGLEAIHSDVMEANDETDENMTDNEDAITFESEDEFEEYVDEIVANRVEQREKQTEKESLATEIVANSAEYDETENVLEDYPTKKALTDKKDLVTGSDSPVTARGTTANAGDPSDTDEYPTASIRGDD